MRPFSCTIIVLIFSLSCTNVFAEFVDYPLYTFDVKSNTNKAENNSRIIAEEKQNFEHRQRLFDAVDKKEYKFQARAGLNVLYQDVKEIAGYKSIAPMSPTEKDTSTATVFSHENMVYRYSLRFKEMMDSDSLLLYYRSRPGLDCRPGLKLKFQSQGQNVGSVDELYSESPFYSRSVSLPLDTKAVAEKSLSYFYQRYLGGSEGSEWKKTEKSDVTVYQRIVKYPLQSKSIINISNFKDLQQVNVIVSVFGRGDRLIEFKDLKAEYSSGIYSISLPLHDRLIDVDPNLNEKGYQLSPQEVLMVNSDRGTVSDFDRARVIVKEIIINLSVNDEAKGIVDLAISSQTAADKRTRSVGGSVATFPVKYYTNGSYYKTMEIPAEFLRRFARGRDAIAGFQGLSPEGEPGACEFDALFAGWAQYRRYKVPNIALSSWDEQPSFYDIYDHAKKTLDPPPSGQFRLSKSIMLTLPSEQVQSRRERYDVTDQIKFDLSGGSLTVSGREISGNFDVSNQHLNIEANNINYVKIKSDDAFSVSDRMFVNVQASTDCGSSKYKLRLMGSDGRIVTILGSLDKREEISTDVKFFRGYEIQIPISNCRTFKFRAVSFSVNQMTDIGSILSIRDFFVGRFEANIANAKGSLASLGVFGQPEHYFEFKDAVRQSKTSIDMPPHLARFYGLEIEDSRLFRGSDLSNYRFQFEYENGVVESPDVALSFSDDYSRVILNDASLDNGKNGRLKKVYIDVEKEGVSKNFFLRVEVKGLYRYSILKKMSGLRIGQLDGKPIKLPPNVTEFDVSYDPEIRPTFLRVSLPSAYADVLRSPNSYFLPTRVPGFSLSSITLSSSDAQIDATLGHILSLPLKESGGRFSVLMATVLCLILVLAMRFRSGRLSQFVISLRFFNKVRSTIWNTRYLSASLQIPLMYLFFSLGVIFAALFVTSRSMIYSLIFVTIISFFCFLELHIKRVSVTVPGSDVESTKFLVRLATLLFFVSLYFLMSSLFSIELNLAAVAIVISTIIFAVFLMLVKGISSSFNQALIPADLSWRNAFLVGILLLFLLGLRSSNSFQFIIVMFGIYFVFRFVPPSISSTVMVFCWIFSCLAARFDINILAEHLANFFFAVLCAGYVLLFYDKTLFEKRVVRSVIPPLG